MNAPANLASLLICASQRERRSLFAELAAHTLGTNATEFRSGMHLPNVERVLAKDQFLALPDADMKLVCLDGELWLTRDGDIEDYILGPGKSFLARRGDRVTVLALRPSRLRLGGA
jgi:hypothetical protein